MLELKCNYIIKGINKALMKNLTVINKEIQLPGLKKTYRILHVTDVHIIMWDERDNESVITYGAHKGKKLVAEFGVKREKLFTVDGVSTADKFAELCDFLKTCDASFADVVVFTGDILDFYTESAFEFMMNNLNKLPMPYMFVLGNHDYIFANEPTDLTFERFSKLCGGNYRIQKFKLGELTLVGSYNGKYAYDNETLEIIDAAIKDEEHVIMFQHVPINSPSLEEYSNEIKETNISIGAKNCVNKNSNKDAIMKLIDKDNSPVHALICGDSHYNHSGPLTDKITQHVSPLLRDFPPVLFTVSGS